MTREQIQSAPIDYHYITLLTLMQANIHMNQHSIMALLSVPTQSNDPSCVFNYSTYKTEKENKNPRMRFLPSEISEEAADTQCSMASPRTALQHPQSTCQKTEPQTQHCCTISLSPGCKGGHSFPSKR